MIVVISAVSIVEGGPLTVLINVAEEISKIKNIKFVFLLNIKLKNDKKYKFHQFECIYLNHKNGNPLSRIWFEYVSLFQISKKINADVWFSMADFSPRVHARYRITLLHNALIWWRPSFLDIAFDPLMGLRALFYKLFIPMNWSQIDTLVVQMKWFGDYLASNYNSVEGKISIIPPRISSISSATNPIETGHIGLITNYIIYSTLPRSFKNIEFLFKIAPKCNFDIWVTITGNENFYARRIAKSAKCYSNIKLVGHLSGADYVEAIYKSKAIIHVSRLETVGLPIIEAMQLNKPIIALDRPWVTELLKNYDKAYVYKKSEDLINNINQIVQTEATNCQDNTAVWIYGSDETFANLILESVMHLDALRR